MTFFFFSKPGFSLFFFFFWSILHPGVRWLSLLPHVFIVLVYASLFVMIRIPCEHFQLSRLSTDVELDLGKRG
jgi:hypothetical protein